MFARTPSEPIRSPSSTLQMRFSEFTMSSAGLLIGATPGAPTPLGQLQFPSFNTKKVWLIKEKIDSLFIKD